ncbi:hypothetical protein E3N88_04452 [Mikania micrantha]|uniref:Uncharacterized protein n=1 Tax=Mikania micrantha TaxID=192012 RepID=A0A5N6PUI8_9ASTR|nr:hypothetical protein E3N88_04452 [Mikania micrantha]
MSRDSSARGRTPIINSLHKFGVSRKVPLVNFQSGTNGSEGLTSTSREASVLVPPFGLSFHLVDFLMVLGASIAVALAVASSALHLDRLVPISLLLSLSYVMECRSDMDNQRSAVTQAFLDSFVAQVVALKAETTAPRSFTEPFLVMAGISRNWAELNMRSVMVYHGKPTGLFDRMKLSTGDGVVETTEAVSEDKLSILEETVGYTVSPVDTVLVTPGKRKNDVASGDLVGPSRRQKIVTRKPPLGGPGLKPKTSGTPTSAATRRVFTSTDSDSTSSATSDSCFSPSKTEGRSGAGRGVSKSPSRGSSPEASRDVEVNPSDPFVPDWKLTNGTLLDTPNLFREFMMGVRPPAEESRDIYMEGVLENRDLKKQLSSLQEKYTTLESNVMSLQFDKEQSAQLVKDMDIKNRQAQTVMQDDLNKKVKVIENMTKDQGVRLGKIGKEPGDDPKYDPSALSKLKELSNEFDDATFPAMATISSMHVASLSEIQEFL